MQTTFKSGEGRLDELLSRMRDLKAHVQDFSKYYACAGALAAAIGMAYFAGNGERVRKHSLSDIVPEIVMENEVVQESKPATQPSMAPGFNQAIISASKRDGFSADYLSAIIRAESGFRHFANGSVLTSYSGHKGVMQLGQDAIRFNNLMEYQRTGDSQFVERSGGGLVGKLESPLFSWRKALKDPIHNIDNGSRYLRHLKDMNKDGDVYSRLENTAASYNVGPGAVRKAMEAAHSTDFWVYSGQINALEQKNNQKVRQSVRDFVADVMSWYYAYSQFEFPTDGRDISSRFGYRKMDGKMHHGVDIAPQVRGKSGDPVRAPADGIVVKASRDGLRGNYVFIQHGRKEWGLSTNYFHGSRLHVREGQRVSKGQVIMDMGSTGRVRPYGAVNLHFGVRANDNPVNPLEIYGLR